MSNGLGISGSSGMVGRRVTQNQPKTSGYVVAILLLHLKVSTNKNKNNKVKFDQRLVYLRLPPHTSFDILI
jgi:hypothetical protein